MCKKKRKWVYKDIMVWGSRVDSDRIYLFWESIICCAKLHRLLIRLVYTHIYIYICIYIYYIDVHINIHTCIHTYAYTCSFIQPSHGWVVMAIIMFTFPCVLFLSINWSLSCLMMFSFERQDNISNDTNLISQLYSAPIRERLIKKQHATLLPRQKMP